MGEVVAVAARAEHRVSEEPRAAIRLLEGLGVEGDAHAGETVRHRSRVARDRGRAARTRTSWNQSPSTRSRGSDAGAPP